MCVLALDWLSAGYTGGRSAASFCASPGVCYFCFFFFVFPRRQCFKKITRTCCFASHMKTGKERRGGERGDPPLRVHYYFFCRKRWDVVPFLGCSPRCHNFIVLSSFHEAIKTGLSLCSPQPVSPQERAKKENGGELISRCSL